MGAKLAATRVACGLLCVALYVVALAGCGAAAQGYSASTFAMDTLVTQDAWGPNAQAAMREVNLALSEWEKRLGLYQPESDIARINAAAGAGGAKVDPKTADLLRQCLSLSAQSEGVFALSIAPLTLAWGITSGTPRVVPQAQSDALLALVDDPAIHIEENHVTLARAGMGLDLGGVAKGAACGAAAEIYQKHRVKSAILSIGGNVYAHGTRPDGSPFRVGFEDPNQSEVASIASFELTDAVVAISGGYHRYFEADGQRYIHIIDPRTGRPAESDILSVGVICADGTEADFYSTTLFLWGVQRTLEYMRNGGTVIMLDKDGHLYVSESLRQGFRLHEDAQYELIYI